VSCPFHEVAVANQDKRFIGSIALPVDRVSVLAGSVQELVWALFEPAELHYDAERDWERYTADVRLYPCVRLPYMTP
jgi:hypothetical protein